MTDLGDLKRKEKTEVERRRKACLSVLLPQWRRCRKTKPRGHIYDGSTGSTWHLACVICGKPEYMPSHHDVLSLEKIAAERHRYAAADAVDLAAVKEAR